MKKPPKPQILIDVGSLFPTTNAAHSKGKPKKDTTSSTAYKTMNDGTITQSTSESKKKESSHEIQSLYDLDSNEGERDDDDDPKKNNPKNLPKSHTVEDPPKKSAPKQQSIQELPRAKVAEVTQG